MLQESIFRHFGELKEYTFVLFQIEKKYKKLLGLKNNKKGCDILDMNI
jgi:hypothetical protein